MGSLMPPYRFFEEYREDVLSALMETEELLRLDTEIANKELLPRYQGPVDDFEWQYLERYYSRLFSDFVVERIEDFVDTTPLELHRDDFDAFRKDILRINDALPGPESNAAVTIPKPAEQLLLKRLRRRRYDPAALDVSYIEQGGPLYLLELFITAAQQQATNEIVSDGGSASRSSSETVAPESNNRRSRPLVSALVEEASSLGDADEDEVLRELREPVLMVSLWDNQRKGLERWLDADREGILEMATATGKTVAGIGAVAHLCGEFPDRLDHEPLTDDARIMVVAHSNAILSQWERELSEKLGLPGSTIGSDGRPDTLSFTTGTVEFRTAHSLLPRYNPNLESRYDLIIYDEVHHYSNEDGFGQAIQRPTYDAALGLSATVGDDEDDPRRAALERLLAPVIYTYDLEDAVEDEIIPQFEWTVHPTSFDETEREEWEKSTESITNQFASLRSSRETRRILERLSVPFTEMEDLGDFIQAHRAAGYELDGEIPDSWTNLHKAINSRSWIRHRSQPKIKSAVDLARDYLTKGDNVKLVMFAMDIETTERLHDQLTEYTDDAYVVHSKVASSTRKKDRIVNRRIQRFANADHGVLIAPKLLDEGIDVPDAEVGINVAGTKTKLQLVQRMGRVLRKHDNQKPKFHHFVAISDEHYVHGIDSKAYVQELNWVHELGELIRQQPAIEPADVSEEVLERAEERGHELWAQDLIDDWEVETVQGSVRLEEVLDALTLEAARTLRSKVDLTGDVVSKAEWKGALESLRSDLSINALQRIWWLYPLYRDRPADLQDLLSESIERLAERSESTPSNPKPEQESEATGREEKTESPWPGDELPADQDGIDKVLSEISDVGRITRIRLEEVGIKTVKDLRIATIDDMTDAKYVGPATAERIHHFVREHIPDQEATASDRQTNEAIDDNVPLEEVVDEIPDVGRVSRARLEEVGFVTVGDVRTASKEDLLQAKHVGPATIDKILQYLGESDE